MDLAYGWYKLDEAIWSWLHSSADEAKYLPIATICSFGLLSLLMVPTWLPAILLLPREKKMTRKQEESNKMDDNKKESSKGVTQDELESKLRDLIAAAEAYQTTIRQRKDLMESNELAIGRFLGQLRAWKNLGNLN